MNDTEIKTSVPVKVSAIDAMLLVNAYTSKPENNVGGNLYMVLSNLNISNEPVEFCKNQALKNNDTGGVKVADALLKLTKTQREKMCRTSYMVISLITRGSEQWKKI